MSSLGEFSQKIRIRARNAEKEINRIVRATALAVDQQVVLETPVDTGRARSNWLVGVGSSPTQTIEPYAPGTKLGKGEGANANAAIAQGAGAIATRKPEQDIFISNNLDYISKLNDGFSAQAPAGFVQKAIQTGAAVIRRSKVFK